jgi:protein-S-isoprenylcysteine O-methyltransferase Ste14
MHAGYARTRHLLAIVALPVTIAVLVPIWLARRYAAALTLPSDLPGGVLQTVGGALLIVGLVLFGSSLHQIVTRGEGTLAPWDPPRRLVIRGSYRFVRNPMLTGVIFVLFGEALSLQSMPIIAWAGAFLLLNLLYIPLLEEPQLEARFGDEYRRYLRRVPRVLPRLRPWTPDER